MSIKIFYDGSDRIEDYLDQVDGVTTNIGFLKKSGITDYSSFIEETLALNKDKKAISFQVFAKDEEGMQQQALKISSFSPDVFVKIPIVSPDGDSMTSLVEDLITFYNLNINVTCIYTKDQIDDLEFLKSANKPVIVSLFCGRIGDTGHDPLDIVNYAVSKFRNYPNVQILWAGCQRVCDIITDRKSVV